MNTTTTKQIHGQTYTTLAGLLEKAHQDGLSNVETRVLNVPHENPDGAAIVHCTVTTSKGTFSATGDASPDNVSDGMQFCLVRLAETRSLARALRFATNAASTAEEEVADPSHPVAIFDRRMRGESNGNGSTDRRVTSRQIALLTRLLRENDVKQEQFRDHVRERFDGRHLEDLSTKEASSLIEELMQAA